MTRCSNSGCELDTYDNFDECILHCPKEGLNFFDIRFSFYNSLENYIADNRLDDFCHFHGIYFPKPDEQSEINYIKILDNLTKLHFDNCHFYTSNINLSEQELFFQNCYFHEDWTLRNYKLLENVDDVIYQNCEFSKKVNTHAPINTWQYEYDFSQFDYTCTFNDNISFHRASFMLPPFHGNQENYKSNTLCKLLINNCKLDVFELYLQDQAHADIVISDSNINSKRGFNSLVQPVG